jgi:hypothetical protein
MKKQWLLVFPICLLLSCVACNRAPFDNAIPVPPPQTTAPAVFIEEGAKIRFVAAEAFNITWCIGPSATCTANTANDHFGPCTEQVQSNKQEKHGTKYVGMCTIKTGATLPDNQNYYYVFNATAPAKGSHPPPPPPPPTLYEFPDNIHQCNPPCR